ncbi:MAG: carboxypeptidase-like regulatory domain-containing protein [Gemmataceae bacterium]
MFPTSSEAGSGQRDRVLTASTRLTQGVQNAKDIAFKVKYDIPAKDLKNDWKSNDWKQVNAIDVRPNTRQNFFLYVATKKDLNLTNVRVRLLKIGNDGRTSEVAKGSVDKNTLIQNDPKQVVFEGPKDKKPKKPSEGGISLEGPPFELQIVVEGTVRKNNAPLSYASVLPIRFMTPSEYIVATPEVEEKSLKLKLSRSTAKFHGPLCNLRLDVSPKPSLETGPVLRKGTYRQVLLPQTSQPPPEKKNVLIRTGELPVNDPYTLRRVYLTVDGYERAIMWTTSGTGTDPQRIDGTRIRLLAPRYTAPTKKITVKVEVDIPPTVSPREGTKTDPRDRPNPLFLKIDLVGGKTGNEVVIPLKKLPGHRSHRVVVEPPSPDGSLVIANSVKSWSIEVNTEDVYGVNRIRAQLLEDLTPLDRQTTYSPVELIEEAGVRQSEEGSVEVIENSAVMASFAEKSFTSPYAPLRYTKEFIKKRNEQQPKLRTTAVEALITFDGTGPEINDFGKKAKSRTKHVRGKDLVLSVKAKDSESGIQKVAFFTGPLDPKKVPKETVPGTSTDESLPTSLNGETGWQVAASDLKIPTDKKGTYLINVVATNQAGVSAFGTLKLELVDPPKPGQSNGDAGDGSGDNKGPKLFQVNGRVLVAGQPHPDATVFLTDEEGKKIKDRTKTDKKGVYTFKAVPPGLYRVIAVREALKLQGDEIIKVPLPKDGKEAKEVDVTMKRK